MTAWFMIERHTNTFNFPLERCVWVNDGESFSARDRTLHAIIAPLFDSPTTRGLYDDRTGTYWAVDSVATPLPGPMNDITELPAEEWQGGVEMFNCMNSPWFKLLDPAKFERHVDRVQKLEIQTLVSCHSPVIPRSHVDAAFQMIRRIPHLEPPPMPQQGDLDELMHCIATGKQYVWEPAPPPNGA